MPPTSTLALEGNEVFGVGGALVMIIGLAVCLAIGIIVVLLVAIPALRKEGRISPADHAPRFRLPHGWTGYDDEAAGYFGDDDGTAHLATREQAVATNLQRHSYVLFPQPARHSVPKLCTLRPRTRHWKVPPTGTGLRTALNLLFK